MKYVYTALIVFVFVACSDTEVAEPTIVLPTDTKKLKNLLAQNPDGSTKLEIYYALYKAYRNADSELAIKYLKDQKSLAEKLENHLVSGKASYNLGLLLRQGGDYIGAVDSYLESISHFEKIEDTIKIATVLDNIGAIFVFTGNYDYAEKFYQKTNSFYNEKQNLPGKVLANFNLGICYSSKSKPDYALAEQYFETALNLAISLNEKREYYLNRIYNQLGIINYRKANYEAAVNDYLLSLEYTDKSTEQEKLAVGYANIGEALLTDGDYIESQRWLDKSLDLLAHIQEKERVVRIYNILGKLHTAQKKYDTAVGYFHNAIAFAEADKISEALQESLLLIRSVYKNLSQQGRTVEAVNYEKVLELDASQDRLERELVEKLNFRALQASLELKIELDKETKAKIESEKRRELISIVAFALGILMIIAAIISYIYISRYLKTKKTKNDWQRVSLHVLKVLESKPGTRPEDVTPPVIDHF